MTTQTGITTGTRVLFTGAYWPGANSLYIGKAFQQCGAVIRWINDSEFLASWSTLTGRILRRATFPLACLEWNRRVLHEVDVFQPDLVYITNVTLFSPETLAAIHKKSIPVWTANV